jgi:hypothetical protein
MWEPLMRSDTKFPVGAMPAACAAGDASARRRAAEASQADDLLIDM